MKAVNEIRFSHGTHAPNIDPSDLPEETLQDLENFEEDDSYSMLQTRHGTDVYAEAAAEQYGGSPAQCEIYGHDCTDFRYGISDKVETRPISIQAALFKDESLEVVGSEEHRGRYMVREAVNNATDDWYDITTHSRLNIGTDEQALKAAAVVNVGGGEIRIYYTVTAHTFAVGEYCYIELAVDPTDMSGFHEVTGAGIDGTGDYVEYVATFAVFTPPITDSIYQQQEFGTQFGTGNTFKGFAVGGFPIAGHKAGYNAMPLKGTGTGYDAFGKYLQFGGGSESNSNYPTQFQFINKPNEIGGVSRGTGFFSTIGPQATTETKGYQGWYFSKAAPEIEELKKIAYLDTTTASVLITDVGPGVNEAKPTVPPGTYTYYLSLVLDGVNETEFIDKKDVVVNLINATQVRVAPAIGVTLNIGGAITPAVLADYIDELDVDYWDAFCKRITHFRVYRSFTKSYWFGLNFDHVNTEWDAYESQPNPRLLCTKAISDPQNLYGDLASYTATDDFKPNPNMYHVYEGSATVLAISASTSITFRLDGLLLNNGINDQLDNVFKNCTLYLDYDGSGDVVGESYNISTATSLLSTGPQVTMLTGDTSWASVNDTFKVRVGSAYTAGTTAIGFDAIDHQFEFAAGEASFIDGTTPRRPNWAGRVEVGEQSFVWDIWEDTSPGPIQKFTRRIRYTTPRDLGYPTVFYDGTIDVPGDEEQDPIQAVTVVEEVITNDTIRAVLLVSGRNSSYIMIVENGEPTIEPTRYSYGLAGMNAVAREGTTVYGMTPEGLMWSFSTQTGFVPYGQEFQKDFEGFSRIELDRSSIVVATTDRGTKRVWVEAGEYADGYMGYNETIPDLYVAKSGLNEMADLYADINGDQTWTKFTEPLYYSPRDVGYLTDGLPNSLGIRYETSRGLATRRTSITEDYLTMAYPIENYHMLQGRICQDGDKSVPVWSSRALDVTGSASFVTKPAFLTPSAGYVEDMNDGDPRGFACSMKTKEFDYGTVEWKNLVEVDIVKSIRGSYNSLYAISLANRPVLTTTLTDSDQLDEASITATDQIVEQVSTAVYDNNPIRRYVNFPFKSLEVGFKFHTYYDGVESLDLGLSMRSIKLITQKYDRT